MSTPVQKQYWELKKQNPEAMLFFRLGDFYELFYEDAQIASKLLGIALTARHKGTENEMPMCGFPHHAHSEYLEKLVEHGYKVAIAEQKEADDGKISRYIDRVITPGTTLEHGNLDPNRNNYLMSLGRSKDQKHLALAYCDLSTGEFRTASFGDPGAFWEEVHRVGAKEILLPQSLFSDETFYNYCPRVHITPQDATKLKHIEAVLAKHFSVKSLEAFGLTGVPELINVVGMVITYLDETQKTQLTHLKKVTRYSLDDYMLLDQQTYQHLEIFQPNYTMQKGGTLASVFEKSLTPMGGRRLHQYLARPLINLKKIQHRQEGVRTFVENYDLKTSLKQNLKAIPDLERLLARMVTGRGNARDMVMLREGLKPFQEITIILQKSDSDIINKKAKCFEGFENLQKKLKEQLLDNPPLEVTQGGMFCSGVNAKLDALRNLTKDADAWLDEFLAKEKARSGINNVRIKYSKNFGFCLEVSTAQSQAAPENWIRRQTLVNAERFTTPELAEYESKVLSSQGESYALEHELFLTLRDEVLSYAEPLQLAAQAIGDIDAMLTLARTADKNRWTAPVFSGEKGSLQVLNGRHPVVESLSGEPFIANDLVMEKGSLLHIITGPNMAGKSTFLRQNAVIVFLAQTGSYVPAEKVTMPVFDRIFTRVGASDHLAGGKSTFYMEMSETAHILHHVTDRSFVILDELGRGTSTFDGLSLAWAITQYLHDAVDCKTLLATHYHELIDLGETLKNAKNYHVSVAQNKDGIIFLRKIEPGGIADSFGIEVAKSAGIPRAVIEQARQVLVKLESEDLLGQPTLFNLPLQNSRVNPEPQKETSEVEAKLKTIDPDHLAPKEALELIYELKALSQD
ncbi:MAG TPA: DNA mismatch repair protein MutS [Candidatus Gracilibacteria bacterium]